MGMVDELCVGTKTILSDGRHDLGAALLHCFTLGFLTFIRSDGGAAPVAVVGPLATRRSHIDSREWRKIPTVERCDAMQDRDGFSG